MTQHLIHLFGLKPYDVYGPTRIYEFPEQVDGYIVRIGKPFFLDDSEGLYDITFTPSDRVGNKYGARVSEEFLLDMDSCLAMRMLLNGAKNR